MFDHCLYFNTAALGRALEREWAKAFQLFGLTPSQAFVLRVILAKPGLFQRELAQEMKISRPTATRALDGLHKLELIERRSSKNDGREQEIYPTKHALDLKDHINSASSEVTRNLKKILGVSRFDNTVLNLKEIRQILE